MIVDGRRVRAVPPRHATIYRISEVDRLRSVERSH